MGNCGRECCSGHCNMFSRLPGLSSQADKSTVLSNGDTKDILKQCHMAPECQTHPRLRTAALY